MKSFEIQLHRGGTWKTDSIYDDRAFAEMKAHRVEESPRYGNLQIIEEIYDEKTEKTKLRSIYRDKGFQETNAKKAETARAKDDNILNHSKREREYKTKRQSKQKPATNVPKFVINLTLIGLLGLGGMVALQFFSAMN